MKVVKGLRKLLHPPELMVWINCGLDKYESRRGFDEIIASSTIHCLDQLWFGWACQAFELLPRISVRPKPFTAGSFGESFDQFSAETLSSLLAIFGHSAERIFSVEMCIFGQKLELTACGFLVEYHKYNFLDQNCWYISKNCGQRSLFSPKMFLSDENSLAVKFSVSVKFHH